MIHPDDAQELQDIAKELGGLSIRGTVSYPSETGSWQLGDTDLGEWFEQLRGREAILLAVPVGEDVPEPITCGICGYEYDVLGPCPRCERLNREEASRIEEKRRQWRSEIKEILEGIETFLGL